MATKLTRVARGLPKVGEDLQDHAEVIVSRIAKEGFEFDEAQTIVLQATLQAIFFNVAELRVLRPGRPSESKRSKGLKRIEKALYALREAVEKDFDTMSDILPPSIGVFLEETLTSSAFNKMTGGRGNRGRRFVIDRRTAAGRTAVGSPAYKDYWMIKYVQEECYRRNGPVLL